MKVHRLFGRWSETASLVPEWMWYAHMFLGAIAAIAFTLSFDVPLWVGLVAFVTATGSLTAGLFHPISAVCVALLGTALSMAACSFVIGGLLLTLVKHVFEENLALYASLAIGALVGLVGGIVSYRPFLVRVRSHGRSQPASTRPKKA